MAKIIDWVKKNKLSTVLLLIFFFILIKNKLISFYQTNQYSSYPSKTDLSYQSAPLSKSGNLRTRGFSESVSLPQPEFSPTTNLSNRMIIKDSYLSLLVENVSRSQEIIIKKVQQLGGYMVSSNIDNPQDTAAATLTVRVPAKKMEQALKYFRQLAIKVISENLSGQDVTDQYVDNEARLSTLMKTKAKFEEILEKATKIEDILNVQREIINLQSQIDAIKGQQQYLEQSANLARITLYLSTDELSLPYAPKELWRPKVIFKQAVRSLISNLRNLGTLIIWAVVYSVIWIPLLTTAFYIYRKKR